MMQINIQTFDILPAGEMQKKYNLYAENRPQILLNPQNVPEHLRDLIPLAEKFGVSCDITRHDLGEKTARAEKQELSIAFKGRHREIAKWFNNWDDEILFTEEAYAFLQLCVFEMEECEGPGLPGKDTDIDQWYDRYLSKRYGIQVKEDQSPN